MFYIMYLLILILIFNLEVIFISSNYFSLNTKKNGWVWMDGWMDGRIDGWVDDGWVDGAWMDGWKGG